MASLEIHKSDSRRWLSEDFEQVHRWLDQYFPAYGAEHRRFRHHGEGIDEARRTFGEAAALAAKIHILRDCRGIPRAEDYVTGEVDSLGLRKEWPMQAYSLYPEAEFRKLVENMLHGPDGTLLWGFIGQEIAPLLPNLTRLSPAEIQDKLRDWERAVNYRLSLPPLTESDDRFRTPPQAVRTYFESLVDKNVFSNLATQYGALELAYLSASSLITPLALIDQEYVDIIRLELEGDSDVAVAKFAMPESIQVPVKAAVSPDNRNVVLVSRQKSLTVSGLGLQQTPLGLEVRFLLTSGAATITVSRVGGRLYLKNGIHRAFVLASLGRTEIPCVLVHESQYSPTSSAYPSFSPTVLTQPRPPLLADFFDEGLSARIPMQKTNKVIRIAAEDMIVPTD